MRPEQLWQCYATLKTVLDIPDLSVEAKIGCAREFKASLPSSAFNTTIKHCLESIVTLIDKEIEVLDGRKENRQEASHKAGEESQHVQTGSGRAELPTGSVDEGQPRESSGNPQAHKVRKKTRAT